MSTFDPKQALARVAAYPLMMMLRRLLAFRPIRSLSERGPRGQLLVLKAQFDFRRGIDAATMSGALGTTQ